jgi:spermidine/putrescine transport system substrate-binding protein
VPHKPHQGQGAEHGTVSTPGGTSRRQFIGKSGAVLLTVGGIGSFASAARALSTTNADEGEVVVLTWGDPNDAKLKGAAFKKLTGITLKMVPGQNSEDFYNKVVAGGLGTYDIVISNVGFISLYIKRNLIEPLDLNQFPASKELYPRFRADTRFPNLKAPNVAWGFPRLWGAYCMTYSLIDTYRPTTKPISWQELWKAPNGKVTLGGSSVVNLATAGRMLGLPWKDVFAMKGNTLSKAVDLLRKLKPFLITTSTQAQIDNFIKKRTDIMLNFGLGFGATVNRKAGKPVARSVVPREGVLGALDGIMLLKDAPNRDNALKYINFEGGKQAALIMWDEYQGPTANRAATEAIIRRGGKQRQLLLDQRGNRADICAAMIQSRNPDHPEEWNSAWDHVLAG